MSKLSKLDLLLKEIQNDENIIRFKELEKVIDQNENLNKDFKDLLDLQKIMVQREAKQSKDLDIAKKNYDDQYKKVTSYLLVTEFLDLLEIINNDLNLIQTIIKEEIDKDFD